MSVVVVPAFQAVATPSNQLVNNSTGGSNSGAAETVMATYTVLANTLAVNGDSLGFSAFGTYAASVNAKRIRLTLGATVIFDSASLAITSAGTWRVTGEINRVTSASAKSVAVITSTNALLVSLPYAAAPTENFATDLAIAIKGTGGASSEVICSSFRVWKNPIT